MFTAGLFQIIVVLSIVDAHVAMIDFEDAVDQASQKMAVMTDKHNRSGEFL